MAEPFMKALVGDCAMASLPEMKVQHAQPILDRHICLVGLPPN
jgi:hypothetical protein